MCLRSQDRRHQESQAIKDNTLCPSITHKQQSSRPEVAMSTGLVSQQLIYGRLLTDIQTSFPSASTPSKITKFWRIRKASHNDQEVCILTIDVKIFLMCYFCINVLTDLTLMRGNFSFLFFPSVICQHQDPTRLIVDF